MMRGLAPLALVALAGCFYISPADEADRLALLDDSDADTDADSDADSDTDSDADTDTGTGVPFTVIEIDPTETALCVDPLVLRVDGDLDAAYAEAEFEVLVAWDGRPYEAAGTATAGTAFAGHAGISFDLTTSPPAPLSSCDGQPYCDHALSIGLSGPASLTAQVPSPVRVYADDPPVVTATVLLDASDAATAFDDVVPSTTPAGAFSTTAWPRLGVAVDVVDPDLTYTLTLLACPDGVDPATDATGACLTAAFVPDTLTFSGDLVASAPTAGFGAAGCGDALPRTLYLELEGDRCDDDVFIALGDARFTAPDCDGDGVDAPADCDDEDDTKFPATYFRDTDGDGLGDKATSQTWCVVPAGWVTDDTDCDDTSASTKGPTAWYADDDDDGFGLLASTKSACTQPLGHVTDSTDCDDGDATIYPSAPETCDGKSNDCDPQIDEGATDAKTYFPDGDGDTFGDDAQAQTVCASPGPTFVTTGGDCDPTDATVYPGALEVCSVAEMTSGSAQDENCNAVLDPAECGTCSDAAKSTLLSESDVDCGGQCALGCAYDQACVTAADCGTDACGADKRCDVWSVMWQGNFQEYGTHAALAPDGDIVMIATTNSLDADVGGTRLPNTPGGYDLAVVRYSPAGEVRWARRLGTLAGDWATAVAVDDQGNAAVAGIFTQSAVIDGFPIDTNGGADVLVVELDPDGVTTQVSTYGGPGDDWAYAMVYDAGSVAIGVRTDPGATETSAVVTLRAGAVVRTTTFDGPFGDRINALARDPVSGDLYVAGYFGEGAGAGDTASLQVTAGALPPYTFTATAAGTQRDAFVARLNRSNGAATWVRSVQGTGAQQVFALAVAADGDVLLGGQFQGTPRVSTSSLVLSSNGSWDAMLAKLAAADGAHRWSKSWGSTSTEDVASLAVGPAGRVIAGYTYNGAHDTDPGPASRPLPGTPPTADVALSVFDPSNGAWLTGASYADLGQWSGDHDGSSLFEVVADARTGQVVIVGATDQFIDVGDGRKRDTADGPANNAFGAFVASLGPSAWPSSLPRDGADAARASVSCWALHGDYVTLPSGTYTIDPNGGASADAFPVYCDMMTTVAGVAGGWTRVASLREPTTGICALDPANGTPSEVAAGPAGVNKWLSPALGDTIPFTRREVMLYRDAARYHTFQSADPRYVWSDIAKGVISVNQIDTHQILVSLDGAAYIDPWGEGQYYMLGALYGGGKTMVLAVGAPGCMGLGVGGMYSGDPGGSYGTTGYVYLR